MAIWSKLKRKILGLRDNERGVNKMAKYVKLNAKKLIKKIRETCELRINEDEWLFFDKVTNEILYYNDKKNIEWYLDTIQIRVDNMENINEFYNSK